ncbi:hypothetical protein KC19_5G180600 [Ceratodon purpureus]|uniref:Uncharacterized protein n=1 Tax=Ceratodon purpureus TaxID=3225 RepID=A0A8T0I2V1_CERPU|nr:hypothetical protein KC19_5G180600 [Ceratodon purpureus]
MGNMEAQKLDLLNIEQEDDSLLGMSPAKFNVESLLGVSTLLSPSIRLKALKQATSMESCLGKDEVGGAPAVVGADLEVNLAPVSCRSPTVPSSVLSILNFNKMNKRSVNRVIIEESWSRKDYGVKESIQLDGIAETTPVNYPGTFTSELNRSYLDKENEHTGMTPERSEGEPTNLRKCRSRRSTTLRKSLAWDKAFFTNEGVLDNDELFAVASDTPKTFTMPELATIWDGQQTAVSPFETKSTPAKTLFRADLRIELRPDGRTELRPEARPAVDPKPRKDVPHTTSLRPDTLHSFSHRPLRQIRTTGSHAFSNAYSRAAAIPQGATSIPLANSFSRTGKQLEAAGMIPVENPLGAVQDMREPRNGPTGLHHQARLAALKKAHEAPLQKVPRVRLPNFVSNEKVEDKHLEELHELKQSRKVEAKPSEEMYQMNLTPKKQPELTRSKSTPALLESPSALSRRVSFMSKKVKETLGKVMIGRTQRVPSEPSSSHVHPVKKAPMPSKRLAKLPTVPEVKYSSHRTKSYATVVPVKPVEGIYIARDILGGKGTPLSPREAPKKGPTLLRSKSACGEPGLLRAADRGPPPVQPSEPVGKVTGLRKPSPKLGFFDAGRATFAPLKASTTSQPLQGMQPVRPGSEASTPIEPLGDRSRALAPTKILSAIPSAPHLRHGVVSAPTSPRGTHVIRPSSPKGNFTPTTRPTSPNIGGADIHSNFSGIRHAKQFAESCDHTRKASGFKSFPASACPSTATSKDRSHAVSAKVSKLFDNPRTESSRESSFRTDTSTDSPVAASQHIVRSYSRGVPLPSADGKTIVDSSPGAGPATPASGGKRHNIISPSHAPDAAGTFEVLTPPSSKNGRGNRTLGSSGKALRKIVEFESPCLQWSNWPVLGAAISADQLPGSAKEGFSSISPRLSREQATEKSTESHPISSVRFPRTLSLKAEHAVSKTEIDEQRSAMEESTPSRFSFSTRFVSTSSKALSPRMDSGSADRNLFLGLNGEEVCPSTSAPAKNENGPSMFSLARKAVTSSPPSTDLVAAENEDTPRSTRKTCRRFSRSGSSSICPVPEPKLPSPFSEARICELEAAGPEILEKKSGPVQNSPPDKVVREANPWSPVRKNGQSLGPFDCTKMKYISPGLTSS